MKRRREPAGPPPRSTAGGRAGAPSSPIALEVTVGLLCVALALWVQRRALGGFFSLDDLVIMEEVRGLRPAAFGLWRLVSRHLFFGAAVARKRPLMSTPFSRSPIASKSCRESAATLVSVTGQTDAVRTPSSRSAVLPKQSPAERRVTSRTKPSSSSITTTTCPSRMA